MSAAVSRPIVPIALAILINLFAIQSRGTAKVGMLFGPIMLGYFLMLAVLGVMHIVDHPTIVMPTLRTPSMRCAFLL